MKLYEKIVLGLVLFLFVAQLLPDFFGKSAFFALTIWWLSLSYLCAGYWLLNSKDIKKSAIPIIAGISFATSLFTLPFTIRIRFEPIFDILPLFNIVLFVGLGLYLLIKPKSKGLNQNYKRIFIRSAIILIVTGFFSYTPASFTPYHTILIALNNGNDKLISNIEMHDYMLEFEDAYKNGDCDRAIENAIKCKDAGLVWLGIPSVEDDISPQVEDSIEMLKSDSIYLSSEADDVRKNYSAHSQLWKISGAFCNLYNAYRCKGNEYFNSYDYENALHYYIKADKELNARGDSLKYWEAEEALSLNQIAVCYKKLYNYGYADSLFIEAIDKYLTVEAMDGRDGAVLYSNLAESMAEQFQFGYSNFLYHEAIDILMFDNTNENNKKDIVQNYFGLIENHLHADSLHKAMFFIEETLKQVDRSTTDFCDANLFQGIAFYKLSQYERADEIMTKCLSCYKKSLEETDQKIAENHYALSQVKIALGKYQMAKKSLDTGIEITTKNYGKNTVRYANYLKAHAHLDRLLGNYVKSEQQCYQVLETYISELGEINQKMPEVLSGLADLETVLGKFGNAKAHSDSSLSIASYFVNLETPGVTSLINNAAYVNYNIGLYAVSDSLYKKTIKINNDYGLQSTASTAIALNGLGLVMTAKRKYQTADSLFAESLKLHKDIFTENHPSTGVVYLNYASLKIEQNKLNQANEMLNKALNTSSLFYDKEHDVFADIYVAFGDLAQKQKNADLAKDYYQKALDIYLVKFGEEHIRVTSTKEKLNISDIY